MMSYATNPHLRKLQEIGRVYHENDLGDLFLEKEVNFKLKQAKNKKWLIS